MPDVGKPNRCPVVVSITTRSESASYLTETARIPLSRACAARAFALGICARISFSDNCRLAMNLPPGLHEPVAVLLGGAVRVREADCGYKLENRPPRALSPY